MAFRIHPEYDEAFLDNDIALIEIISPIPLVGNVGRIPLPRRQDAGSSVVNLQATASGFGATVAGGAGSQFLRFWEQPVAPDSVWVFCRFLFNEILVSFLCAFSGASATTLQAGSCPRPTYAWTRAAVRPFAKGKVLMQTK
jgi:hypothetical protein